MKFKFNIKELPDRLGKKYIPILLILMSLLLFLVMRTSVAQKQKVYKEGQLAEETVRANKTIENKTETEEKQRLAMESVTPEYSYDATKADTQVQLVKSLFDMVDKVNKDADRIYNEKLNLAKDKKTISPVTAEERLPMLKSQFEKLNQNSLAYFQSYPDSFYESLFNYSAEELANVKEQSISVVETIMSKKIRNSNLQMEKQAAKEELQYVNITTGMRSTVNTIIDKTVIVNEVLNEKATEQLKQNAKQNVQPVMIYQGEIIVREGEQIEKKLLIKSKY